MGALGGTPPGEGKVKEERGRWWEEWLPWGRAAAGGGRGGQWQGGETVVSNWGGG